MIRKISGKTQSTLLKHVIKNDTQVTNIKDIADTMAETSADSSPQNSNIEFHKRKDKKEKKLNFKSDYTEGFNGLFSLSGLKK